MNRYKSRVVNPICSFFAGMSSAAVVIYESDNIVKVRRRRKL